MLGGCSPLNSSFCGTYLIVKFRIHVNDESCSKAWDASKILMVLGSCLLEKGV